MEQILVAKKATARTFVFELPEGEDPTWAVTNSFYLNKVVLGKGAAMPKAVKLTVEVIAD